MHDLIPRWMKFRVEKALKVRRIVNLAGVRQSGKTTLTRQLLDIEAVFRTLDNPQQLRSALEDPAGFIKSDAATLVIDELQKAPILLPMIKMAVDLNPRPGRFLLTGSANVTDLPAVAESLAGRVSTLQLRTLAVGEVRLRPPLFLRNAFDRTFPEHGANDDRADILRLAFQGGYPETRMLDEPDRLDWMHDYLEAILSRDLFHLANIRRHDALRQLVDILASWSAKYLNLAEIGAAIGVARQTLDSYVGALEKLYLFEQIPCWITTDYERVGRRSKWFCTDSGLLSAILRWRFDDILDDSDRSGKLMETFVFHELAALADLEHFNLFHYRDRARHEVDFIVENDHGDLLGIEVKTGSQVRKDDFKHLYWFRDNIAAKRKFTGIVLYTGPHTASFADDMKAVPASALWQ